MSTGQTDCVALITARGGSKRLPGKNVKLLAGRPLIAWSVLAALEAKNIRRVIVSTDDPQIAEAARLAGAEIPFMRPAELSGDMSSHYDVVAHAIDWLERDEGRLPDYLCLLQPTSPLRRPEDIDGTIDLVVQSAGQADTAIAVSQVSVHPRLMYNLRQGRAQSYLPPAQGYVRTQDLEPVFYVNGAVYVLRPYTFRQRSTLLSSEPAAYVMDHRRAVDIDDADDFEFAEFLMQRQAKQS
ncbi:cytidylyltransferase domain-containing protein [Microvirga makkahensis]|uniref:Acylneuraminate cytidylyltransferase family protein n=1 Tax=Microvirga makkahensis TaxID=1128670 RepID=A0A7X3MTR6_9HYPH|nr:acylneuraminate cytidylyltransferase family protein [Microvirga makkahensis]MXQ12898.1 acylneuraminate cytidylyltransferase family protein [Microvirga makkahensis]